MLLLTERVHRASRGAFARRHAAVGVVSLTATAARHFAEVCAYVAGFLQPFAEPVHPVGHLFARKVHPGKGRVPASTLASRGLIPCRINTSVSGAPVASPYVRLVLEHPTADELTACWCVVKNISRYPPRLSGVEGTPGVRAEAPREDWNGLVGRRDSHLPVPPSVCAVVLRFVMEGRVAPGGRTYTGVLFCVSRLKFAWQDPRTFEGRRIEQVAAPGSRREPQLTAPPAL